MTRIFNHQERLRFFRFMVVGIIGTVVDFGIFNLLHLIIRLDPVWSSIISFCSAVISNFIWNRFWTYPDSRSKPITWQLFQFGLVNLVGLIIRTPLFALIKDPLSRFFSDISVSSFLSPEFLGHNIALAIAIGIVLLWNFFINRFWTYNDIGKSH